MDQVTINGYYLIGLIGFGLLMSGLYLIEVVTNGKERDRASRRHAVLREERAYFIKKWQTEKRRADMVEEVRDRQDKDLETCQALLGQREERIARLEEGLQEVVRGYVSMSNEYAEYRVLTREAAKAAFTTEKQRGGYFGQAK